MFTQIAKFIDRFFNHVIDKNRYKPNILDCNKTVDLILQKKMSIARYGDGEFSMMLGRKENIGFQQIDDNLSFHLQAVFEHPDSNVLICIPKVFDWKDRFLMNRTGRRFWSRYLKRQSIGFFELMKTRNLYGDSRISRPYIDTLKIEYNYKKSEKFFKKIKTLWNEKKILIVEGELTRFGVGNDLISNSKTIRRILCPATNCWSSYSAILEQTETSAKDFDLVILALGPTATVLANDLASKGIWALDLGHLDIEYEWFLQKAFRKTSVSGKYVNETKGGDLVTGREDKEFCSQIICRILSQ